MFVDLAYMIPNFYSYATNNNSSLILLMIFQLVVVIAIIAIMAHSKKNDKPDHMKIIGNLVLLR